jgi:hypothetical protein
MMQGQMTQPEPFWPDAPQDIFDYVLWAKGPGLWAHGYGAIVASAFAPPPGVTGRRGGSLAAADAAGQTTGAAPPRAEPLCGDQAAYRVEGVVTELRSRLAPANDEAGALAVLHPALVKVDQQITAACPRGVAAAMPDRLRSMQDRMWGIRVALTNLRDPLQKFHDALTDDQKAKLDAPPSEDGKKTDASAAGLCLAHAQGAPQWPAGEITRAVGPNRTQQASLATLSQSSAQMSKMMLGSCPQKMPATALARLDAALDWLDATLFAATNVVVHVDDFYRTLNDAQKAKLDTLSR